MQSPVETPNQAEHAPEKEAKKDISLGNLSFIKVELVNKNKFIKTMIVDVPLEWTIMKLAKFYFFFHKMSFTQLFTDKCISLFYKGIRQEQTTILGDILIDPKGISRLRLL